MSSYQGIDLLNGNNTDTRRVGETNIKPEVKQGFEASNSSDFVFQVACAGTVLGTKFKVKASISDDVDFNSPATIDNQWVLLQTVNTNDPANTGATEQNIDTAGVYNFEANVNAIRKFSIEISDIPAGCSFEAHYMGFDNRGGN